MESRTVAVDEIDGTDPQLRETLGAADLPTDDLTMPGRRFFRFSADERAIGFVGYEEIGAIAALLRSLVVLREERGKGHGRAMVQWIFRHLSERGIESVWMITTTAQDFGLGLGFVRASRDSAPEGVRATRQFASLCPSSATLMHKSLV